MTPAKIRDGFVAIHGHFYQPPRENPWLEAIEAEESAHPFHDWNEKITFECYRPNAYARLMGTEGKILEILNNYASMSFNFGPTLFSWLEKHSPSVYKKIIRGDQESLRRLGHGNAIAQTYHHLIMPLASERDQETEILWGIADFESRFRRKPEAMWLPEAAVSTSTLRLLVKHGMRYLILSPFQARRVKPFGAKRWVDVSEGRIDPTQPYRCFVKDGSGKKALDQSMDIFFYDGVISKEVSFGDLLRDGNIFCDRFRQVYQETKKRPQLIHIATDGENYGHHKKFGEMALAYALKQGFSSRGLEVINYGTFLKRFPPAWEVEIDEGPKGEGTSWSCGHGVDRWKEDCGCSTGGQPDWNQQWRKPLREALDLLRDELSLTFEREGEGIFRGVWEARDGYIEVILDRSSLQRDQFFDRHGRGNLGEAEKIKGLKLLEMQRHALKMFTSCGWFFADLAGIETILILQYAARAIQLAEGWTGRDIEKRFIERLSEAKSNLRDMGNGDRVYRQRVKPRVISLERVVNQFALSSFLDGGTKEKQIFSYRVEPMKFEKLEKEKDVLVLGQVRVTPEIIPEPKEFVYGLMPSQQDIFRTWVSAYRENLPFDALRERVLMGLGKGEEGIAQTLTALLGKEIFTLRDALKEEKQAVLQKLIQEELDQQTLEGARLFDRTRHLTEILGAEGLEIPYEIRVAEEAMLSNRLIQEMKVLREDFRPTVQRGEIDRILSRAKQYGYPLKMEKPLFILEGMLKEKMERLKKVLDQPPQSPLEKAWVGSEMIEEIILLLDLIKRWDFEFSKVEAQDAMHEILEATLDRKKEGSWKEGEIEKIFAPLLALAEKLDFNRDQLQKMVDFKGL